MPRKAVVSDSSSDESTKKKKTPVKKVPAQKTPTKTATTTPKKPTTRIVKVFEKVGQKKETPDDLDGSRLFYQSLHEQNPSSEMAARWCIQHGVYELEKHNQLVKKWGAAATLQKKTATTTTTASRGKKMVDSDTEMNMPAARAATAKKTPTKTPTKRAKPNKKDSSSEDDDDDDDESSDDEEVEVYTPKPRGERPPRGKKGTLE